jgi:dynein heavy chain
MAQVKAEEVEVKRNAVETQALKDEAQADLEEALPAMSSAMEALGALNKSDITEMRTFSKPPPMVKMTMEAVNTLLGEKTDWDTAKKVL